MVHGVEMSCSVVMGEVALYYSLGYDSMEEISGYPPCHLSPHIERLRLLNGQEMERSADLVILSFRYTLSSVLDSHWVNLRVYGVGGASKGVRQAEGLFAGCFGEGKGSISIAGCCCEWRT